MSVAYADTTPRNSLLGTGATSHEWLLLAADEVEAEQKRTHIVSTINDPVLRDVLDNFHDVLLHKLTSPMARVSSSRERQLISPWHQPQKPYSPQPGASWYQPRQISPGYASPVTPSWYQPYRPTTFYLFNDAIISTPQSVLSYWTSIDYTSALTGFMSTSYDLLGTNAVAVAPLGGFDALDITSITPASFVQVATAGNIAAPYEQFYDAKSSDLQDSRDPVPTTAPLAVSAVEDIANWLGVPAADIFGATGIAKRTYQEWKKGGIRRPRPASEGRLWELHRFAADLVETMGPAGVRSWFRQDPSRRVLLQSGAIDQLASQAYTALALTDSRPPWVGVGSSEDHVAPRREVTLDRMDPRDVVEPEQ